MGSTSRVPRCPRPVSRSRVALQVTLAVLDAAIGSSAHHHRHGAAGAARARGRRRPSARWPSPARSRSRSGSPAASGTTRHHRPADLPDRSSTPPRRARRDRRARRASAPPTLATHQPGAGARAATPRRRGSTGSSARSARRSPSTTSAARPSTPTRRPPSCSAAPASRRCWPPSPASSRRSSRSRHEDGSPVQLDDLPGRRLIAGEDDAVAADAQHPHTTPARRSGCSPRRRSRSDADGARLAINIIEDVTEAKDAELRQRFLAEAGQLLASSLDYQQTLERVARMIVPAARRLVRHRHASTSRASRGRWRSPTPIRRRSRWRTSCARRYPAGSRLADRRAGDPARRPGRAVPRDPRRAARRRRRRRGAPANHPRGRHALGDGGADADRRARRSA